MEKSIGERLRDERKKQGLSIEDVSHATRIHADTVLGLEEDDYSGFASTTYAKSFLKKYANHLGVDASDALAQFSSDATSPIVGGANYIRSVADAIEPVERISGLSDSGHFAHVGSEPSQPRRRGNNGSHPIALGMFLVVLLAAITVLIIIGKDAETPDEALQNLKKLTGGEDSGEAEAHSSISAAEVDARPGTRISPAAPLTRPSKPKAPAEEVSNNDPQPPFVGPPLKPLAQANIQKPTAVPVAKPIRATPVVAKPVKLPTEDGDENTGDEDNGAETNNAKPDDEGSSTGSEPESNATAGGGSGAETAQN